MSSVLPTLCLEHGYYSHLYGRCSQYIDGVPFFHRFCHDVNLRRTINDTISEISVNLLVTETYGLELADLRRTYGRGLPFSAFADLSKQIFGIMKFFLKVSLYF